jgi:hypothetical protein
MRFPLLIIGSALLLGCQPTLECLRGDYACNLRVYTKEIRQKPPEYGRASQLAQRDRLSRNVQNVLRAGDESASGMLRVLSDYPPETRRRLCSDGELKTPFRADIELIR